MQPTLIKEGGLLKFRKTTRTTFICIIVSFMITSGSLAADFIFHGASQFDESHEFTRTLRLFEELVQLYYTGDKSIEFVMHLNSESGRLARRLEKPGADLYNPHGSINL